jgi:hypothetical protein
MPDRLWSECCCPPLAFVAKQRRPNSGIVDRVLACRLSPRGRWRRSRRGASLPFRSRRFACAAKSSPVGRRQAVCRRSVRRTGHNSARRRSALRNSALLRRAPSSSVATGKLAAMCNSAQREAARRSNPIDRHLRMIAAQRMQGRSLRSRSCVRARSFRRPLRSLFDGSQTAAAKFEPCRGHIVGENTENGLDKSGHRKAKTPDGASELSLPLGAPGRGRLGCLLRSFGVASVGGGRSPNRIYRGCRIIIGRELKCLGHRFC